MIVKYFTAQQRLAFGDKEEAKSGFYWQTVVEGDPWIGPFETLEEASTDGNQCCFGVTSGVPSSPTPAAIAVRMPLWGWGRVSAGT